jgi:hypothetical protein
VALPWSGDHTFVGNIPVSQNTLIGIMWVLTAGHERL